MKSTLITFEGMIRKKFKADEISYQEAPQIELYFPKRDTESYQGDGKNTTTIQCLLKDHYENGGGLKYYLWDGALPTPWAVDCVTWGIVNKDDFRLDQKGYRPEILDAVLESGQPDYDGSQQGRKLANYGGRDIDKIRISNANIL